MFRKNNRRVEEILFSTSGFLALDKNIAIYCPGLSGVVTARGWRIHMGLYKFLPILRYILPHHAAGICRLPAVTSFACRLR